jgi:hypothetical protein
MAATSAGMGQDLIIKNDDSKIYCRVIRQDSLTIYYIPSKASRRSALDSLSRSLVRKIYLSEESASREAKVNKKVPSPISAGKYLNYPLAKGDTLLLTRHKEFEFKGGLLYPREVEDLMSRDSSALAEVRKADKYRTASLMTYYLGTVIAITPLKVVKPSQLGGALLFGGAMIGLTLSVGIPLATLYGHHAHLAVRIFNTRHR